jgi:hypothetical protein
MDVSAVRPTETVEPPHSYRPERPATGPLGAAGPERPPATAGGHPRWLPPSTLKFTLTAADVQARFEIHEATSTVTVTMYERDTGEVLRQVPSRDVLDVIAALTSSGMQVDELR